VPNKILQKENILIEPFALLAIFMLEVFGTFPLLRLLPDQCRRIIAACRQKNLCPADAVIIMNMLAITLSAFIIVYFVFLASYFCPRNVQVDVVCSAVGLAFIWISTANTNGYMECQSQWMRKVRPPDDIHRN